jgi:hypothetical protein
MDHLYWPRLMYALAAASGFSFRMLAPNYAAWRCAMSAPAR